MRSVLQDTEGVARVQLNSLGRQVMVGYDEERVCQDELIDALIEAGFIANAV